MAYNGIDFGDHSYGQQSTHNTCHSSPIDSVNMVNVESSSSVVISLSCAEHMQHIQHIERSDRKSVRKHSELWPKTSSSNQFESSFTFDGMRDVPQWLKTLRLHKYASLFSNMSYDRMLALSEQELESLNVTKGARHKLIVSINKLNNRPNVLNTLYTDLCYEGVCCVRQTLLELKNILMTPIKRSSNGSQRNNYYNNVSNSNSINNNNNNEDLFLLITKNSNGDKDKRYLANNSIVKTNCDNYLNVSDDDLPEMITRLLSKVYVTMNGCSSVDEDCINMYNIVVDKCLVHDAFTSSQKNRIHKLKQPVHKTWPTHCSHRRVVDSTHSRRKTSSHTFHHQLQPRAQIYRTHSAPVSRSHLSQTETHSHSKYECEQLNDIEKLCIRMTEQALGLSDGGLLYQNVNQDF